MFLKLIITLVVAQNLIACSSKSVQLNTFLSSNRCGLAQQKLMYIESDRQLHKLFNASFNNPIKSLEKIDYNNFGLVLISMGQQPNSGYSIKLNNTTALLENNILKIDAVFNKPQTGRSYAQVITSPCALYKTNKISVTQVKLND